VWCLNREYAKSKKKKGVLKGMKGGMGEVDLGYFWVEEPGLPPVCEAILSHF